jgi:hypothetical protein
MSRVGNSIIRCLEHPAYERWSRRCGLFAGVLCANYVVENSIKHNNTMLNQAIHFLDPSVGFISWSIYTGFALTTIISCPSVGFLLGPLLPIVAIPGLLYKLTDPVPEQKVTPKLQ